MKSINLVGEPIIDLLKKSQYLRAQERFFKLFIIL